MDAMEPTETKAAASAAGLKEALANAEAKIEEQNREIAELRLRKAQYDSILENMTECVERSGPDYRLLYVNEALCQLYNVEPEALLGQNTMDFLVKEDCPAIDAAVAALTPENPYYKYEYRVRQPDGSIVWVESVGRCFYDEYGNVLEYQDVGRDITHFKNLQGELERQVRQRTQELAKTNRELAIVNQDLKTVLASISEGIVVLEADGNGAFWNYGPDKQWLSAGDELLACFKRQILQDTNSYLHRLIFQRRKFGDVEMHFPLKSGDCHFVASGVPLQAKGEDSHRSLLVLKPIAQVHKLVNIFSGAQSRFQFSDIVTNSGNLQETIFLARQAAASDCSVLIEGESGTGKELFAQSIHNSSARYKGPFVAVNCGAIPRELVGSEMLGYDEGAFTGAKKGGKPGKFELARGGTIFLDEIGDMPLEQQAALLRVIQERRITRVGGSREIPVDVRIICATNKDLLEEVMRKNFRQDLYYRLNVINLHIPPLRERKEDILLLFSNFLARYSKEETLAAIDPKVLAALSRYDWPGNVRELQNVAERVLYLSGGAKITPQDLPQHIAGTLQKPKREAEKPAIKESVAAILAKEARRREESEEKELLEHLKAANGNISLAARNMGVARSTLYRRLKRLEEKTE